MSGLRIDHNAWVLVGDGEKALFFRNAGDATAPNLKVVDVLEHQNPRTSEQGTDRPGRSFASVGARRSALQETNWHRLEKHRFAKEIADALHAASQRGQYEKLVIAAPPVILGDIRKALHKDVSDRIVAEVAKDLTNMPSYEIERTLIGHGGGAND